MVINIEDEEKFTKTLKESFKDYSVTKYHQTYKFYHNIYGKKIGDRRCPYIDVDIYKVTGNTVKVLRFPEVYSYDIVLPVSYKDFWGVTLPVPRQQWKVLKQYYPENAMMTCKSNSLLHTTGAALKQETF